MNTVISQDSLLEFFYNKPLSTLSQYTTVTTTQAALYKLQETFGYHEFRPGQAEAIEATLNQSDSLILLPTGGGKSLCYQIPGLILPGITLVISPLIALMKDQVDELTGNGIAAAYLNNTLSREKVQDIYQQLHNNTLKFLYVAPERLFQPQFMERLQSIPLSLIAIDEAHCVSQWGHDFRPEYARLGQLKYSFPNTPVMALTATADRATRKDILQQLQLHKPFLFTGSFDRPNIRYTLQEKFHATKQTVQFLKSQEGQCGIIYCSSRKRVDTLAEHLVEQGFAAAGYHAGLDNETRQHIQDDFRRDNIQIVVATVAFGMGINKPNIRFVLHYDIPKNIESYYQETGRAGRDGLSAEAVFLYDPADIPRVRRLLENNENEDRKMVENQRFNAMAAFAEAQTCRRVVLLNYFDEFRTDACNNCDICLDPPKRFDGIVEAQKALSCVYRVGQRFGVGYVIDVLRGSSIQRIKDYGHDKLSTYGIGKEHSHDYWLSIFRQLIHHGYLLQDITQSSILKLTENARCILKGEVPLQLATPRLTDFKKKATSKASHLNLNYDKKLFARLKKLRKLIADEGEIPPFVVFSDATLVEMCIHLPTNEAEFLSISGVGQTKLSRYGDDFMAEIFEYSTEVTS